MVSSGFNRPSTSIPPMLRGLYEGLKTAYSRIDSGFTLHNSRVYVSPNCRFTIENRSGRGVDLVIQSIFEKADGSLTVDLDSTRLGVRGVEVGARNQGSLCAEYFDGYLRLNDSVPAKLTVAGSVGKAPEHWTLDDVVNVFAWADYCARKDTGQVFS